MMASSLLHTAAVALLLATSQPTESIGQPSPYVDRVVSFQMGRGGGYGQDKLPDVVLGPPKGGGKLEAGRDVLSLGEGGVIVLEFVDNEVFDGPGPDFIVFENPFLEAPGDDPNLGFFEFAKVEVSLDGVNWTEFPYDKGTGQGCAGQRPVLANADENEIEPVDPGRAGGDPFDLGQIGLKRIRFVRITDVQGHFGENGTAGFDLDGIAAINSRKCGESIEVVRDPWGIPHVFSTTDSGAMYGLGYATAEDRAFQMQLVRRIMQGRVAETIGNVQRTNKNEDAVQFDRAMRTMGYYTAAHKTAENLDRETAELLLAYCEGVNACLRDQRDRRHYLFDRFEFEPEPWRPTDCLVVWWHIARFFGPDGTRDLMAQRAAQQRPDEDRTTGPPHATGDETAAVVRRDDVSDDWLRRVEQFAKKYGLDEPGRELPVDGPSFSHAWVVGGRKTTTGSAVLVSDPQTLVGNPPLFYEFHIQGQSFNARGIGVPGTPIVLIGFTDRVAWGMTALGADQADLFQLQTDARYPDQYFYDGQWRDMTIAKETVRVRGGTPQELVVHGTHLGPVVTEFVFAGPEDGQFALKRVPLYDTSRHTIQGAIKMMRSHDVHEFLRALGGWRFPSANVVVADVRGNIGYSLAGELPVRSAAAANAGRFPHDGSQSKYDWQTIVPQHLLPHVINPARGYLYSANHRPVGSFYPIPIGNSTGAMGYTLRSLRLHERLAAKAKFRPEDVLDVHFDNVNPARRDLVRAGYHLRDVLKQELPTKAQRALEYLEEWYQAKCPSDLSVHGAALALEINVEFRTRFTDLAARYGGGDAGLCLFLNALRERLDKNRDAGIGRDEVQYVGSLLAAAWDSASAKFGPDPEQWDERARRAVTENTLGYFVSLEGFPSLDPQQDLLMPELTSVDRATIRSQIGQSYTQFVPLHDVDQAQSVMPIGESERPDSPYRTTTRSLWASGQLHPAPLSRAAVERYVYSRKTLERHPEVGEAERDP